MIKRELALVMLQRGRLWADNGLPTLEWKTLHVDREQGHVHMSGLDLYIHIDQSYGQRGNCRIRIEIDGLGYGRLATVNREMPYNHLIRRDSRYLARDVLRIACSVLEKYLGDKEADDVMHTIQ
jgi:hypothetical protein